MVYWNFGDFIKSSSLDINKTKLAKAKISRLEIVTVSSQAKKQTSKIDKIAKIWIRKFYLRKVICKVLRTIACNRQAFIKNAVCNENMRST